MGFRVLRVEDLPYLGQSPGGAAYAHVRFICAPGVSLEHVWEKESERERESARGERERDRGTRYFEAGAFLYSRTTTNIIPRETLNTAYINPMRPERTISIYINLNNIKSTSIIYIGLSIYLCTNPT